MILGHFLEKCVGEYSIHGASGMVFSNSMLRTTMDLCVINNAFALILNIKEIMGDVGNFHRNGISGMFD